MDKYLSPAEVCALIPGMSIALLAQMRFRGDGPRFVKPSPRTVVYAESDVAEYLRSRTRQSTADRASA
jgi:predicted DNA-binding transcriptional regulator AlpA